MVRSTKLLVIALGLLAAAAFTPQAAKQVSAMPTFAQAYGLDCKTCHTEVPSLNAYGRYVQRTMYAGLDPAAYKKEIPIWMGETVGYSSTGAPEWQAGNLEVHAVGVYPNWTFHVQQWIWQGNAPGGLDTAWVSYNGLLHGNGHIVLGKMPGPGPSFWSMWSDVSGFAAPAITIGEHTQALSANRWGGMLAYGTDKYVVQAGYYGSQEDLNGAGDWAATPINSLDKGYQFNAEFQRPDKPVSVGLVGNIGSFPLAEGGYDRYNAIGAYGQVDPTKRMPGALFYYQIGNDDNPIAAGIGARSTAYSAEVYFPILARHETMLGFRREMTNDGMGNVINTGEIDLGGRIFKYLHADVEAGLATGGTPVWGGYLWYTQPFGQW
jgi:hypothetical protein